MRRWHLLLLLLPVCVSPAFPQETTALNEQSELVRKLLDRIDALERRVSELENRPQISHAQPELTETALRTAAAPNLAAVGQAQVPPAASNHPDSSAPASGRSQSESAAAHSQAAVIAEHRTDHTITQGDQGAVGPQLVVRGFADIDFSTTDSPLQSRGFDLGQVVLHMSSSLSRRVSAFGELSFTARNTQFTTEVERIIIRYDVADALKVSFGKYHTPVSYWNAAFHHGSWLQTTISRPEMIAFGTRYLPVHFVGAQAEGAIPSGTLGLNYSFGVGNGRHSNLARDGDAGDINHHRAWTATIFARPANMNGFQIGGSVYRDNITADPRLGSTQNRTAREWISSGHIVWGRETPEFLAEVANIRHRDAATGKVVNTQALYAQLAYRLPFAAKRLKPYYRFEYIHVPAADLVLDLPSFNASILGTRFDVSDYAAFKLEYRNVERGTAARFNGVYVQTAFTF